jgi:hypothetical protein
VHGARGGRAAGRGAPARPAGGRALGVRQARAPALSGDFGRDGGGGARPGRVGAGRFGGRGGGGALAGDALSNEADRLLSPLSPIDDVRGTAAYRRDAVATLVVRALREAAA